MLYFEVFVVVLVALHCIYLYLMSLVCDAKPENVRMRMLANLSLADDLDNHLKKSMEKTVHVLNKS